jgi:hypothetical protein
MAMELDRISAVLDFYEAELADRAVLMAGDVEHLRGMIPRLRALIAEGRREKVMRWYGFIQGALWAADVFTVEELKAHSNPDAEPPRAGQSR